MSEKRSTLQVIGVGFLIFCSLSIFLSLPFFWRQIQVLRTWPITDAQVLRSDVMSEPVPSQKELYSAKLQLLYTVNGHPITADLVSYQSSNYQATQQRVAEFPVGSHHPLRYDPQNPVQARLGAGWNARFFAVPLLIAAMGAGFGVLALACLALASRT